MRKALYLLAAASALLLTVAGGPQRSESFCVIFPQGGRDIFGVAQRNIIIFDVDHISLIPQVHFEGDARDFGILVPVPSNPQLTSVDNRIFSEASFMTQPMVRNANQGCNCGEESFVVSAQAERSIVDAGVVLEVQDSGVIVVSEQLVGMYQAVILQATHTSDLVDWLNQNQYRYNVADSSILSQYVADNWFFVAMKLDTSQVPAVIDQWWNATTNPAKITFKASGESVTYPLKISAISTREKAEILVYTIGRNPMRFDGAKVEYANAFDETELSFLAQRYPALYDFLTEGTFVTKLRRTFRKSEMQQDIAIYPVQDRREFRQIIYSNWAGMQFVGMLILVVLLAKRRRFWR